jgi:mono/diheme cytochrome c family protein
MKIKQSTLLFVGLLAGAQALAFPPSPQEEETQKLDGGTVFELKCQVCHGPNMVTPGGGAVFDLRKFPLDDKPRFVNSVLKGKNAMPAWEGIITTPEIEALWEYIQTSGK